MIKWSTVSLTAVLVQIRDFNSRCDHFVAKT